MVTGTQQPRLIELDLLRLVAVLLVMGRHASVAPQEFGSLLQGVSSRLSIGGWVGVDVFFVLSGFLVTSLLINAYVRDGRVSVVRFLTRRAFKLYPAFWCMIGITLVYRRLDHGFWESRKRIASELLFVQNYWPMLWNHTWSLAVEEHFYLVVAAAAAVVLRPRSLRRMRAPLLWATGGFLLLATACLMLRLRLAGIVPQFDYRTHLVPTHLRLDSLGFGALLAAFWHAPRGGLRTGRVGAVALVLGGAAALAPAFIFAVGDRAVFTWGFALFYLGGGALLIGALNLRLPPLDGLRAAAFLGSRSYSVYLWHLPVQSWIAVPLSRNAFAEAPRRWLLYAVLYVSGSFLIGCLMHRWIEGPLLRLRDRLIPRRARAVVGQTPRTARPAAGR